MDKKYDLAKIFNLEGIIKPRPKALETSEEVSMKNPYELSLEIKEMLDDINMYVEMQDIDSVIKTLNACEMRLNIMKAVALKIKRRFGG